MKPGDLVWHNFKEGARMVVVLEVRYWPPLTREIPEWVQVLDRGESLWTAGSLIEVIDGSGATAG